MHAHKASAKRFQCNLTMSINQWKELGGNEQQHGTGPQPGCTKRMESCKLLRGPQRCARPREDTLEVALLTQHKQSRCRMREDSAFSFDAQPEAWKGRCLDSSDLSNTPLPATSQAATDAVPEHPHLLLVLAAAPPAWALPLAVH